MKLSKTIIMRRFKNAIAVIMLTVAVVCAAGCTKPNEPNNVSGNYNGHDYVDLGLPSGTLWATCNVGANASEEYGDFFAWGETQPKDIYDWSTYQHCNGGCNGITKYCSNAGCGNNGFADNLITLQPEDDAATVNWGNGWCMPTRYQLEELSGFTNKIWTTQNGVNGYLFTGFNGNTIFLPAAGYRYDGNLDKVSSHGGYWSSTLDTNYYSYFSWRLYFGSGNYNLGISGNDRYYGLSVRPVCSSF